MNDDDDIKQKKWNFFFFYNIIAQVSFIIKHIGIHKIAQ